MLVGQGMTDVTTQDEKLSISTIKENIPLPVNKQEKKNHSKPELVDGYDYIPDPYKKVATGMEKQFAEFMITQMESSTGAKETNSGAKYYKSLMNSERADMMASKDQGMGLQKVILDQIYPERMRTKLAYNQFLAQQDSRIIRKNEVQMTKPNVKGQETSNE
jgi:Rod binding domain-containing protein